MPARYNTPKALGYGLSTPVTFALETQGSGSAAHLFTGLLGDIATADVMVGSEVQALLTGPADLVKIEPRGPPELQRKTVTRLDAVQWTWDIKAVGVGTAVLQLELFAFVDDKKSTPPLQVKTFQQSIPIEISVTDRLMRLITDLDPVWKFGATVFGGLAAILAYFGFKPNKAERAGRQPEPAVPSDTSGRPPRPSIYGTRRQRRT